MKDEAKQGIRSSRVLLASLAGFAVLAILLLTVIRFLNQEPEPAGAPDGRAAAAQMTEYYGEQFDVKEKQSGENYMRWTLLNSKGTECHVVKVRDYSYTEMIDRYYDDYSVKLYAQTVGMKTLLTQSDFPVGYVSHLELGGFNDDLPACYWVLTVQKSDDLAPALRLVLNAVNSAGVPEHAEWQDQNWGSVQPAIRIVGTPDFNTSRVLAQYIFCTDGSEAYDFDTELRTLQDAFDKISGKKVYSGSGSS